MLIIHKFVNEMNRLFVQQASQSSFCRRARSDIWLAAPSGISKCLRNGDNVEKRVISTELAEEDIKIESNLRPLSLDDYIGQDKVKRNLKVYIQAARERGDALDHVLFYGPPGLGKTTLARVLLPMNLELILRLHQVRQ